MVTENKDRQDAAASDTKRIVKRTISFLRELFCWHDYEDPLRSGYFHKNEVIPGSTAINHGRKVKCKKCGKEKWLWSGWVYY